MKAIHFDWLADTFELRSIYTGALFESPQSSRSRLPNSFSQTRVSAAAAAGNPEPDTHHQPATRPQTGKTTWILLFST